MPLLKSEIVKDIQLLLVRKNILFFAYCEISNIFTNYLKLTCLKI